MNVEAPDNEIAGQNMIKYAFLFLFLVITSLFLGCEKGDKLVYEPIPPVVVVEEGAIPHVYSFYPAYTENDSAYGGMVLLKARDSVYTIDTTDYHKTTGFIDEMNDSVFISKSFWMDTVEVSRAEWVRVMGDTIDTIPGNWPRTGVSWFDAIRYCMKRTDRDGLTQVYDTTDWASGISMFTLTHMDTSATGYRLPTEDEWEYAARAGRSTPRPLYATSTGRLSSSLAYSDGTTDTTHGSIYFRKYDSEDSAWILLTPDTIFYTYIPKQGGIHSDTLISGESGYYSILDVNGYRSYSYSLIRRIDTTTFASTFFIDSNVNSFRDSTFETVIDEEIYLDTVWYFDTLVYYHGDKNGVLVYDTLKKQIKIGIDYNTYPILHPVTILKDEIAAIDTLPSTTDKVMGGDSALFITSVTEIDTTRITRSFIYAEFKPVGHYVSNRYGLYEMSGNAFEWVWDVGAGFDVLRGYRVDYLGPDQGTVRMRRGGSFRSDEYYLRCGGRDAACAFNPIAPDPFTGFRTIRKAD